MRKKIIAWAAALIGCACVQSASAAVVLQTTELLANTASAGKLLPDPIDFQVSAAGTYEVKLQDVKAPQLFKRLAAIVTRDLQVVAELSVSYPVGSSDPQPATDTFAGTPGTYRIHVLGEPPENVAGGTFGITVTPVAGGTALVNEVKVVNADPGPPPGQTSLEASFTVQQSGSHQLVVNDQAFPDPLAQPLQVLLTRRDDPSSPVLIGSPPFSPFAASAGEIYDLVVFATAGARQAGLFDVRVTGPSSSVVYQSTTPVGAIAAPVAVTLPAAGVWSLTLADTNFPVSLTDTTTSPPPPPAFAAALVQNGAVLGVQTGAGTKSVTAAQGAAQLFTFATSASVGAFSINIAQSGTVAFADVQTVDNSDDPSTDVIYSFAPTQSIGAGGHRFTLKDYRLPQALANLRAALVQSGTVVQRIEQADSINVVLTAGLVKVLVAARPAVTNSVPNNGLFGFELATQSGGTVVAEGTQGVGGLFHSRPLPIDTAGQYDVQLADLQFPQALQTRILAITRGTDLIGQIIGPDSVRQPLQQGTYVLSFLGRPANGLNYGAYGLKVSTPPPAPTLTLTADPTSVTSGQRTTLTWTSTDTTSCTAGGSGWTGTKTLTGTEQSNALNTNTTFTLDCSGPGGSINRSVTIDVTAPSPSGGGGGGGSTGLLLLGVLSVLAFARNRQASSAVRGFP